MSAKETIVALAKTAAEEVRLFAEEVADAAAAATAAAKSAAGVALDKVATSIEQRAAEGANAASIQTNSAATPNLDMEKLTTAETTGRPKRKAKRVAKKRFTPRKGMSMKKTSRSAVKKERT